ncbi:MOSC domain-containing protein [Arthrobacter zhangbolii]|uniref:MOSC domain-containing protein n=1 Tax=Arthrobacter zhangbolii TaxID=2886936 RepID=A0A9X1S8E0_9MICC|nr:MULTISPECIES: MOSC N-terminal beta barrel domain-containing protein [Arthrobacter]MCC3272455.1 MOSC domain-containing protein [Arthrobacter zhangbolii]MDN3903520.1 MOSC domain-containing protein [Arthrobacter sp. YD2]UON91689.1 MOSC domain-containing protein [Arthrobacter zhangbolii]
MRQMGSPVGTVRALYRYPVKSTAGEALAAVEVTRRGLRDDRLWAVYTNDGGIASGKRTRRFRPVPGLMQWSSSTAEDGVPLLTGPDGRSYRVDEPAASTALSSALGRELRVQPETTVQHHDETPLHLLTTSSLAALDDLTGAQVDERRFRANIIIDTGPERVFTEDAWIGAELALGPEVLLQLGPGMPRCVMVDQPQAGVDAGAKALKVLGAHHRAELGLQAHVLRTGMLRAGDTVTLHLGSGAA